MLGEPGWRHLNLPAPSRLPDQLDLLRRCPTRLINERQPGLHRAATPHRYTVRVYYEDTDAAGIVYHANYLRFAERARTEALRELGIPHAELLREHNLMFVVRRIKVDYLRPARLDELLVVLTEPVSMRAPRWCCARTCKARPGRAPCWTWNLRACRREAIGRHAFRRAGGRHCRRCGGWAVRWVRS